MSEVNSGGTQRKRCTALFTSGHIVLAISSFVGIGGSSGIVFTILREQNRSLEEEYRLNVINISNNAARLSDHSRAILDLSEVIRQLRDEGQHTSAARDRWQAEEKTYDAELRGHIDAMDARLSARLDHITDLMMEGLSRDREQRNVKGSP